MSSPRPHRRPHDDRLHILGIRHHGPGSATAMLSALDAADPAIVLIEGPADATDVIPFVGRPSMQPPIALLVHGTDDPSVASFYPFAVYSPEWQAMRWALARGRPVRFVDLPAKHRIAEMVAARKAAAAAAAAAEEASGSPEETVGAPPTDDDERVGDDDAPDDDAPDGAAFDVDAVALRADPLGHLARLAGYEDGEAWWNALIEQGVHGPAVFTAIEAAMAELRGPLDAPHAVADPPTRASPRATPSHPADDPRREAHMRLAITQALGETAGAVAVVCGAWHAPALRRPVRAADDRAVLERMPRVDVTATWVPWTDPRLASASGYAAGVRAPGWYAHVWREFGQAETGTADPARFTAGWQARIAALLRERGRPVSTAAVIEATRLALTLAALRGMAVPGLDEMREGTLAALCHGDEAPWRLIETELVVGRAVGVIDDDVPQMPLAADLARWQRRLGLAPEGLDRELQLDLRTRAGLQKSLLLHRLRLLGVDWGRLTGQGSRGTFRETWVLCWLPEYSVKLAEALVHGTTIEQAAGTAAVVAARATPSLAALAEAVHGCLVAGLPTAARETIALLQARATAASDIGHLAAAVPPLANVLRYGTAREMPTEEVQRLVVTLCESVSAGLVYGCRNLQVQEAVALRGHLDALSRAVVTLDLPATSAGWHAALRRLADDPHGDGGLQGFAVRTLHERGVIPPGTTATYLSRALSRAVEPRAAGAWLDGFLDGAGQLLVYDAVLRGVVDAWLVGLTEADFVGLLPMLRRSTATIDRMERRRVLDDLARTVLAAGPAPVGEPGAAPAALPATVGAPLSNGAPAFAAALPLLSTILGLPRAPDPADAPSSPPV